MHLEARYFITQVVVRPSVSRFWFISSPLWNADKDGKALTEKFTS